MNSRTILIVLAAIFVFLSVGVALRGHGTGLLSHLAAIHGGGHGR